MSAQTIELAAAALAKHEAVIARGLKSFIEVGDALLAIRSERLYLATHETFSEYCQERWGFSDSRARQLVIAAQTVTNVTVGGLPAPTNEGQTRELAKVPEPEREQVWRETLERTDGKPTAAAVREVASPAAEPEAKPAATPDPEPEPAPRPTPRAAEPRPADPVETPERVETLNRALGSDPAYADALFRRNFNRQLTEAFELTRFPVDRVLAVMDDEMAEQLRMIHDQLADWWPLVLRPRLTSVKERD